MSDLGALLQILFPNNETRTLWEVTDEGNGPYISKWNLPDPQPTPEQLESARPALEDKIIELARKREYPALEEIVEAILAQLKLVPNKVPELESVLTKINIVDINHPKIDRENR